MIHEEYNAAYNQHDLKFITSNEKKQKHKRSNMFIGQNIYKFQPTSPHNLIVQIQKSWRAT